MPEGPSKSFMLNALEEDSSYQPGNNHLLLIGIDQYQQVAKLANAVRDAQAFKDLLHSRYTFEAERTYELYDERATRKGIMGQLRKLTKTVQPHDNLVVYFSGHGRFDELIKEGYWVPVDAEYDDIDDYITYSFITKVIKAIPAQHTVFIVDSCYSGAVLMRDRDLGSERLERDPSRWMIASGRNEVVPDGIAGNHSPFADKLINILERYATEGLRMGSLVEKLITSVTSNSKQTPIGRPLYGVGDQGGEFFFRPKRNQAAEIERLLKLEPKAEQKQEAEATRRKEAERRAEETKQLAAERAKQEQQAQLEEQKRKAEQKKKEEDTFWKETRRNHSPEAYQEYLDRYPKGRYREDAHRWKISRKKQEKYWAEANQTNSIEAYQHYLATYPGEDESHREEAKERIETLKATLPQRRYALDWRIPAGVVTLILLIALGIWAAKLYRASHAESTINSLEDAMVLINGGTFTIGSNERDDEKPHQVTLSDFYIGKYEVTQAEWKAVMGTNPSHFTGCDQCPVEGVSWEDIQLFIDKLNSQTNQTYRLPTEAEWEYAAGGGSSNRTRYAGTNDEDSLEKYAWYDKRGGAKTHPVGEKLPNDLGLYDMSGNVWEWCHDWYASDYYRNSPGQDPAGPRSGAYRVFRGGSWSYNPQYLRVADRYGNSPDRRYGSIGFRLSRTP